MRGDLAVLRLWPPPSSSAEAFVSDDEVLDYYAYPAVGNAPYVRVNYVCSTNGKIAVAGRSAGLGSRADKLVFGRLRRVCDVILVGAGTVKADDYRGARSWGALRSKRRELGLAEIPPIAVVSGSASVCPESRLFTDAIIPPIIFTTQSAPVSKVARLVEAGAEVIQVGEERAEVKSILDALAARRLYRVLCEGGPTLFGDLIANNAVDDLCFTLAPFLGGSGGISVGSQLDARRLCLESVISEDDALLFRYRVAR